MVPDDSLITRIDGCVLILMSSLGLFFNVSSLFHFLSVERSSFYIMCTSKTISNSIILSVYLLYNGPSALFYTIIGPDIMNHYLNQAVTYGIFLLGPFVQSLITINRLLVVWTSPAATPRYSNQVTVAVLAVCWLIGVYITTMYGFTETCLIKLVFEPLEWSREECTDKRVYKFMDNIVYLLGGLAIGSNLINVLVVIKLILLSSMGLIGLFFNVSVFIHFLAWEKTSFYLICTSKSVSNSIILLVYVFYNGPSALMYTMIGSQLLNRYLNQAISYGVYLQGPMTQVLITVNRFLVVWASPTKTSEYSNRITVGALAICWLISFYFIFMPGALVTCLLRFNVQELYWLADECVGFPDFILGSHFLYVVLPLGLFSNCVNVLACFQDWIYVLDTVNSLFVYELMPEGFWTFFVTLGSNVLTHVADG
ncbi:unnamed protein product [Caenorhabditis sp. 36 PRJEB53466]|nr:unnamed protein product [Caenorhabditis sp. 36 PRJEB53466]